MPKDDERKVRLKPRKPRAQSEWATWSTAYKIIMHHARMTGDRSRRAAAGSSRARRIRPYFQRCAVRVMYAKNRTEGQWRAHGRYVARESAAREGDTKAVGFDGGGESIDIAKRLEGWQNAQDERFWKLIISPEFGDRLDLKRLTRDLIGRMERDLGTSLEWAAVAHYNTEHPHVHVALRGVSSDGRAMRLDRDYIKHGIREVAEDFCTRQIGYRSELDAVEARRREVHQQRFTSLDQIIKRDADVARETDLSFFKASNNPARVGTLERRVGERLRVLESMGLAEHMSEGNWQVRRDFESILRAMQRSADRQKTLATHGALLSDQRLRLTVLDLRQLATLEGRILVHGDEESSGRSYLMLEGTDGQVHHVYYTPDMEMRRACGGLRINSFIRLQKVLSKGRPRVEIDELGDSEAILRNRRFLREKARSSIQRGFFPEDDGWNGWLGRYQKALQEAAVLQEQRMAREAERRRVRDRGR